MLFDYAWTRSVWFGSLLNLRIEKGDVANVLKWSAEWMDKDRQAAPGSLFLSKIACIGWYIWKTRNAFIFNHTLVNPKDTIDQIAHAWREGTTLGLGSFSSRSDAPPHPRGDPPPNMVPVGPCIINCDASYNQSTSQASAAAILRNSAGYLIDGMVSSFRSSSAFVAEARVV